MKKSIKKNVVLVAVLMVQTLLCQKQIQPASAAHNEINSIESKIVGIGHSELETLPLFEQLKKIEFEYDSITGRSETPGSDKDSLSIEDAITRLSGPLFMATDPEKIFTAISNLMFTEWKLEFEKNETNPDAIFPDRVLKNGRGTCLGMSLVVLAISEKLGFPVYGVVAPGHFFIRFDNGTVQRNFETLRRGEAMPESWYRMRWSIKDTIRHSLKNCLTREVIGSVYFTLGNSLQKAQHYKDAIEYYKRAIAAFPDLIEAKGNLAIVYDVMGERAQAISLLSSIADQHPELDNVHSNLAALLMKASRFNDAEKEYQKALKTDSANASLHLGLAVSYKALNKCKESGEALSKALFFRKDYDDAFAFKHHYDSTCAGAQ